MSWNLQSTMEKIFSFEYRKKNRRQFKLPPIIWKRILEKYFGISGYTGIPGKKKSGRIRGTGFRQIFFLFTSERLAYRKKSGNWPIPGSCVMNGECSAKKRFAFRSVTGSWSLPERTGGEQFTAFTVYVSSSAFRPGIFGRTCQYIQKNAFPCRKITA